MIDYNRVVQAFGGKLVSLTPRRAKSAEEESPGMVLKIKLDDEDGDGEVIALEDAVSKVIDDLAAAVDEIEGE